MSPDAISKAIRVLSAGRELEDSKLIERLVADGVERSYATRLVLFIPVAYARLVLGSFCVKFSDYFLRSYGEGRVSAEQRLDSDAVWLEVRNSAEAHIRVLSRDERRWIAGRSPEFKVINQVLNDGLEIKDSVLSPLVVWWPEE